MRLPWSLLCPRLNKLSFLNLSLQVRCSIPLIIFVTLFWGLSKGLPSNYHIYSGKVKKKKKKAKRKTCISHILRIRATGLTRSFSSFRKEYMLLRHTVSLIPCYVLPWLCIMSFICYFYRETAEIGRNEKMSVTLATQMLGECRLLMFCLFFFLSIVEN